MKCMKDGMNGKVQLKAANGWTLTPKSYNFSFSAKNEEKQFEFSVTPKQGSNSSELKAEITLNGQKLNRSLFTIDYPHIQPQTVLPIAKTKIIKVEVNKSLVNKIGYIIGSGDKIPNILSDLGFDVQSLNDNPLTMKTLKNFDAVITGIRAYNTNKRLKIDHQLLMNYVYDGGTVIVQ